MTTDGRLVPFRAAPYPYDGLVPAPDGPAVPFLRQDQDGRLFHQAPRGGKLFADHTYSDNRSLIYIPHAFDIARRDATIILFLHGNLATLEDVRGRQRVTRQLSESKMNAVLVAPQLAVNALDSSPGHFYEPGFFQDYMREAAMHLAATDGRFEAGQIDALPIVIVAYSGGYLATAFSLDHARGEDSRIKGVILLDALFGEEEKFKDWIEQRHAVTFFVSAYSDASIGLNTRLREALQTGGVPTFDKVPPVIGPGDIVFQAAPAAGHNDFVTKAWVRDPLRLLLARIRIDGKPLDQAGGADGPR